MIAFFSARDRNRTDTPLLAADFESAASTNSATRAKLGGNITTFQTIVECSGLYIFLKTFKIPFKSK
jgi:hypothetical protein